MNNERWEKAKEIFSSAVKLTPELRVPYLDEICRDDPEMRREVESLLASHFEAEGFMESPAVGEVADVIHRAQQPAAGKCFGHYEIIELLGAGGMGEVYLAEDKKLDRRVAVKILNEKFARHDSNLDRFKREAKAASALNHPNILVIHEIGEDESTHYIVSEFINGQTLGKVLRERSLRLSEVLDISIQIAAALCAAHEAHLVHRDLKPENVMLRADGIVKVLDFGLAKLVAPESGDFEPAAVQQNQTAEGIILGTANYMSPEQARGQKVDPRTDIFSFGCVFYEMLTGQQAFKGETVSHTIIAVLEKEPPPLSLYLTDLPVEFEMIVKKCLAKNPAERYGSAKDLLADLRALEKRPGDEAGRELSSAPERRTPAETQYFELPATVEVPGIVPPNNLTEHPGPIVGREKEIAAISHLLRQPAARLVTLTGIGGTGKTRLAHAVARALLTDFPDGVFFVELAAVTRPELVASAVAQPFDLKEAGGKPILEILKDYLREKKLLLVIDNFEQVADAAPQIGELLTAARLKVLITSRTLLRLSAEHEFTVPPLAVPSETRNLPLETIAAYDAVKLFVQRARKAKSSFELTAENAVSVAEICARLDGLPLAIELAAARVKIFTAPSILGKLDKSLRLLTGGARDLPERQQTMRGAVEWSYGLLDPDERRLFRRLSVFAGGFTFEAAEAVCADDEASAEQLNFFDLLTSLVEKSLLVTNEQPELGETRFRMLEVVREYGLELFEADIESAPLRRRHAEYFLALGEQAESHLQGEQAAAWLDRLEAEHDNIRTALGWALENDPETAARLAGALRLFWNFHGHLAEGRQWLEKVLESRRDIYPITRWKILHGIGLIAIPQGDYQAARKFLEQSREAADAADDRPRMALSTNALVMALVELGEHAAAQTLSVESLAIGRELDDKKVTAQALYCLGELARSAGDYEAARRYFEESLEFFARLDITNSMCACYMLLGAVTCMEGDYQMSRFYYENSLKIGRKLGHKGLLSYSFDGFAALAAKQAAPEFAARLAGAAETLRESIGFVIEKEERRFREAYLAELKTKLDEADFSEFYGQGRKMQLEEVLTLIEARP